MALNTTEMTLSLKEARALRHLAGIGYKVGDAFALSEDFYPKGLSDQLRELARRAVIERVENAVNQDGKKLFAFTTHTKDVYDAWYQSRGWRLPSHRLEWPQQ